MTAWFLQKEFQGYFYWRVVPDTHSVAKSKLLASGSLSGHLEPAEWGVPPCSCLWQISPMWKAGLKSGAAYFCSCFPVRYCPGGITPSFSGRHSENISGGCHRLFCVVSGFSTWHCYGHPLRCGGSTHLGPQCGLSRKIRMLISIPFESDWSYPLIMWHLNVGESERHKEVSARISLTLPTHVRVYIRAVMWKGMLKISWDHRTSFPSQKQALCYGILQSPLLVLFCSLLLPEKWKSWAVEQMRCPGRLCGPWAVTQHPCSRRPAFQSLLHHLETGVGGKTAECQVRQSREGSSFLPAVHVSSETVGASWPSALFLSNTKRAQAWGRLTFTL